MGLRTGKEYVESLRDGRKLFINGSVVSDVASYAPFRGAVQTLAGLYDTQTDPRYIDTLTQVGEDGERFSTTLLAAQTLEEMETRLRCEYLRTDLTYGLMGRLPDFMAAFVLDTAAALRHMGKTEAADKADAYLAHLRANDLAVTHTLIDPQSDRSKAGAPNEAVRVVAENEDGITVRGARLLSTLAPLANEIFVGPYVPRRPGEEDFALIFSIPAATEGLKIVCREPYDLGRAEFDRPLSGRFDEGDAILIFDDVFVPWDRVIVARDLEAYNGVIPNFPGYAGIQGAARSTAKLRFLTGLAGLLARTNGRAKAPRYQEEIGELVGLLNVAEGLLKGAVVDTYQRVNARAQGQDAYRPSGPGEPREQSYVGLASIMFFFPGVLAKAIETVRIVAGSGAIAMTRADFDHPELHDLVEKFLHGPDTPAEKRLQIMKLAWDITGDQFGGRQALYERYYTGDPITNRLIFFGMPKRVEAEDLVSRLLGW
ncbi:4-hydroxyphenylacetate 3-hydroxylase family protein [Streptosporangium carneum]|uniref:4-hydroxyphenylacetate 3-monooxygenase oxygenase component n=1 Tax=Streptosporangium carneum TaxID=47481 RepID=A0A9W6MBS9_9ACTN|nr:4-hydroxyphenylacetate 3-hydroxylase N-terminal domain-containing protein [Streptosporangium carneum]GLK08367.1 4-hydroxyphenylacetate 3-monooxygenase oxygenase component [Streptosporangium carneum]